MENNHKIAQFDYKYYFLYISINKFIIIKLNNEFIYLLKIIK